MEKILTIAIPTYNRRTQLIRLLRSIESQECTDAYNILISDNCSNYSIEDSLKENFSGAFRDTIQVMRREVNGGGDYNISSLFQYAKTKLFWIIGDDDELLPGSIKKVLENYEKYPDIPFYKYAMSAAFDLPDDIRIQSVDDFIRCNKKGYFLGGIFFISNNIYNVEIIKPYFSDCLYYGYCSVSQIIPMMHCLVTPGQDVMICKDNIVKYNIAEGDGWNYVKVVTSLSTVLDINWNTHHNDVKRMFRVICGYFGVGEFLIGTIKIKDKSYREFIYWKGMHTVFKRRKNILDLFAIVCYKIEVLTHVHSLTGLYVSMLNKQTEIQNKFREKAAHSEKAAKLFYFLKKHVTIMK